MSALPPKADIGRLKIMFKGETDERRNTNPIDDVSFFEKRDGRPHIIFINLKSRRWPKEEVTASLFLD
jgi:cytolysin (calcineurin-like family phosphatase)